MYKQNEVISFFCCFQKIQVHCVNGKQIFCSMDMAKILKILCNGILQQTNFVSIILCVGKKLRPFNPRNTVDFNMQLFKNYLYITCRPILWHVTEICKISKTLNTIYTLCIYSSLVLVFVYCISNLEWSIRSAFTKTVNEKKNI